MIWIGIGAAIVAWLIGLLVEVGPVAHLLLLAAVALVAVQLLRTPVADRS